MSEIPLKNNDKLGPFLGLHMIEKNSGEYKRMEATGIYAYETIAEPQKEDPIINVTLRFYNNLEAISKRNNSIKVRSVAGNIATVEAPTSTIKQLVEDADVEFMEASTPLRLELDHSVPETKVDSVRNKFSLKGKGTIIGIIDGGFDFTHYDLRNSDGSSRIIYMWDQNDYPDGIQPLLGRKPSIHDMDNPGTSRELYGQEYHKADIDYALQKNDPFLYVRQKDDGDPGHGTHVTGIAGGNGNSSDGKYMGMAPEADLIVVKYWSMNNERLGDSNALIDAINYIFQKADEIGKPCCCNISMGNHFGAHDGTSEFELFIDEILKDRKGHILVKSAGNDGNKQLHAEGLAEVNHQTKLNLNVLENDIDDDLISLWYHKEDQVEISLSSPDGFTTENVSLQDMGKSFSLNNGNVVEIAYGKSEKDRHRIGVAIALKPGSNGIIQPGLWSINVTGKNVINGRFDAWVEKIESGDMRDSYPQFTEHYSNDKTISIPGTSQHIITVGNYHYGKDISPASSKGPTSDGRIKPDVCCPGSKIYSAASSQVDWDKVISEGSSYNLTEDKKYVELDGTSMAAPALTGIISLLLEKNRDLTANEIKNILHNCCRRDSYTGNSISNRWGHGKVDALNAMENLEQIISVQT